MSLAEENTRLRECLDELVALSGLPARWTGSERGEAVSSVSDALPGMLGLAFIVARISDPEGGPSVELALAGAPRGELAQAEYGFVSARLGPQDKSGILVAASPNTAFPDDIDRLVVRAA